MPRWTWLMCALVLGSASLRAEPATVEGDAERELKQRLEARMQGIRIQSIRRHPRIDMYEVVYQGSRIFYTDERGEIGLFGSALDLETREDLTQQRIEQLQVVDFAALPLDRAIVKVKGDGSRSIAVFSDPDCPFCQRLERELERVDNVTIYVFLFPIPELHPDASRKARRVWCSAEQGAAWDAMMLEGTEPPEANVECADPIAAIAETAASLGIDGTPGIVFPSGRLVPGAISAEQIEELLNAPPRS